MSSVIVAALTHDLVRKRSIVTLVWDDDPEKRVALPVPFGCGLDERSLRRFPETFRTELAEIQAGARNGGGISPRRHGGLLTEFERVKTRYDAKIANLRARYRRSRECGRDRTR